MTDYCIIIYGCFLNKGSSLIKPRPVRSESAIKVLKTPASIIRHGLVGGCCDRLISDSSSNRDQRRLVYGNSAYGDGGGGNASASHEQQWGEKKQSHTAIHYSCCMADTFANVEAQRVEHQHVHWPDECGGRLVKDGQQIKMMTGGISITSFITHQLIVGAAILPRLQKLIQCMYIRRREFFST